MISITVIYASPQKQIEIPLLVEDNCTIKKAIMDSKIREHFPEIPLNPIVGVNSKVASEESLLQSGDRVEIYRPLKIDPKQARRNRVNY